MTKKEKIQAEARQILLENYKIKPTSQLLIFIKSVSQSGMSRQMIIVFNNQDITYYINQLLGYSTKKNYIRVGGCGMDMAFHLADTITYWLWQGKKPKALKGNGGGNCRCIDWKAIY